LGLLVNDNPNSYNEREESVTWYTVECNAAKSEICNKSLLTVYLNTSVGPDKLQLIYMYRSFRSTTSLAVKCYVMTVTNGHHNILPLYYETVMSY
jgi:hypothetical protein